MAKTNKEIKNRIDEIVNLLQNEQRENHFCNKAKFNDLVKENIDNLDYIRFCIKYLLLDVDSLKRENLYLRKLFEMGEEQ